MNIIHDVNDFATIDDALRFAAENPGVKFRHFCVDTQTTVYIEYVVNPDGSFILREDGFPDHFVPAPKLSYCITNPAVIHLQQAKPRQADPVTKAVAKRRKAKKLLKKQKR